MNAKTGAWMTKFIIVAVALLLSATFTSSALPPVVILDPLAGDILQPDKEVECISAANITKIYFLLANSTDEYAFDGTAGNTTDFYSTDGWKATIQTDNFADGTYNITVRAFAGDTFQAEDTEEGVRIDHTDPAGGMVIWGSNGTAFTGSRNVHLNLTYTDNHGVYKCRYANDIEFNLNNALWESCTTVKSWILSEGDGTKTVYYQIKDFGENTANYSDTIYFYPTIDSTPPTSPTVYDGLSGDDVDWWSQNTSFSAHWSGATDDMSTVYYKYSVWNSTDCISSCSYTDVGTSESATETGLSLEEGKQYRFNVQTYIAGNITAGSVFSDGATVDLTDPDSPVVDSATHPDPDTAYPYATVQLNWTAEDPVSGGVSSGIYGYSYSMDKYPATTPDTVLEGRVWETLAPMRNTGHEQVLKINDSGVAYAVYSQVAANFTENDSVRVKVALAEMISDYDDDMTVNVSLVRVNDGTVISNFVQGTPIAGIESISTDIKYAYTLDIAEEYQFNFTINETVDDGTYDFYVVVMADPDDDDNRRNLSIGGTSVGVDTSTKAYVCDESDSCTDNSTVEYAIQVERADSGSEWETTYSGLGDGIYYFHVRAQDSAGNWGNVTHRKFIVDAGGVSIGIASPTNGELFTTDTTTKNISVKVVVAANATVNVTAIHPDGSNYTSPSESVRNVKVFNDVALEYGQNIIYATAKSTSGAVTTSSTVYVLVTSDEFPATNKTLRVAYGGAASYSGTYMAYADETDKFVGIATETSGAFSGMAAQADTELNYIKIFITSPFDAGRRTGIESDLGDNTFLDRKVPMFGDLPWYVDFVIVGELRYEDVSITGDFESRPSGMYDLIIMHQGLNEEGDVQITVETG